MALKKAQVNSSEQRGESPIVDYVGDEFHEPTPGQITNALTNLKSFKFNRYKIYYHRLVAYKLYRDKLYHINK
jgi:hypothetical protein